MNNGFIKIILSLIIFTFSFGLFAEHLPEAKNEANTDFYSTFQRALHTSADPDEEPYENIFFKMIWIATKGFSYNSLFYTTADVTLKGHWHGGNISVEYPEYVLVDADIDGRLIDPIGQPPVEILEHLRIIDYYDYNRPFIFRRNNFFRIAHAGIEANFSYQLPIRRFSVESTGAGLNIPNMSIFGYNFQSRFELGHIVGKQLTNITSEDIEIKWTAHKLPYLPEDQDNEEYQITKHKMYVVGSPTITGRLDHTLVDLGCEVAANKTTDDDIFDAIWAKISDKQVPRIDKKEAPGNDIFLKYWGPKTQAGEISSVDGLLANEDGNCYSWTELVEETLKIQGVTSSFKKHRIKLKYRKVGNSKLRPTVVHKIITEEGEEKTHNDIVMGFLQKTGIVQGGTINLKHPINPGYSGPLVYEPEPIVFGYHSVFSHYSAKDARTYYYDPGPGKGKYENIPLLIKDGIEIFAICENDFNNRRWVDCNEFTELEINKIFEDEEYINI